MTKYARIVCYKRKIIIIFCGFASGVRQLNACDDLNSHKIESFCQIVKWKNNPPHEDRTTVSSLPSCFYWLFCFVTTRPETDRCSLSSWASLKSQTVYIWDVGHKHSCAFNVRRPCYCLMGFPSLAARDLLTGLQAVWCFLPKGKPFNNTSFDAPHPCSGMRTSYLGWWQLTTCFRCSVSSRPDRGL